MLKLCRNFKEAYVPNYKNPQLTVTNAFHAKTVAWEIRHVDLHTWQNSRQNSQQPSARFKPAGMDSIRLDTKSDTGAKLEALK